MTTKHPLFAVLAEARTCTVCASALPLGPRPLLAAHPESKIVIIGQAPGKSAHESGIPWHDRSGDRLRDWLGVTSEEFYDPKKIAIVPMGFCYPGTGATGDLPPRQECAPLWHPQILPILKSLQLTIYVGAFSFNANLGGAFRTLTESVESYRTMLPGRIVLPHPSPRNGMWVKQRPWFEAELLPALRERVRRVIEK